VTTLRGQLATLSTLQQAIPAERQGQRERERDLQKRLDDLQLQVGRSQEKKKNAATKGGVASVQIISPWPTEFMFSSLVDSACVTRNV
jgi:predicted flavoprotein YhiN